MHKGLLLLLAALATQAALADDDEIVTDRPGLVESSTTIIPGHWQLETGLAWERDGAERRRATPLLLRVGLSKDWELRLATDGALRQRIGSGHSSGWADGSLGLKWHWQDGDATSGRPGLAWLFQLDADSGSAVFRGQGLRPSLRLSAEWELPGNLSAGVIGGFYRDRNEVGRHYVGGIFGASLGWPVADGWEGYAEIAGEQLAASRNGGSQVSLGTGLSWLLDKRLQLDASVNCGLNRNTPDWVWGLGLSVKF